jgi:hypothetical protein
MHVITIWLVCFHGYQRIFFFKKKKIPQKDMAKSTKQLEANHTAWNHHAMIRDPNFILGWDVQIRALAVCNLIGHESHVLNDVAALAPCTCSMTPFVEKPAVVHTESVSKKLSQKVFIQSIPKCLP